MIKDVKKSTVETLTDETSFYPRISGGKSPCNYRNYSMSIAKIDPTIGNQKVDRRIESLGPGVYSPNYSLVAKGTPTVLIGAKTAKESNKSRSLRR